MILIPPFMHQGSQCPSGGVGNHQIALWIFQLVRNLLRCHRMLVTTSRVTQCNYAVAVKFTPAGIHSWYPRIWLEHFISPTTPYTARAHSQPSIAILLTFHCHSLRFHTAPTVAPNHHERCVFTRNGYHRLFHEYVSRSFVSEFGLVRL